MQSDQLSKALDQDPTSHRANELIFQMKYVCSNMDNDNENSSLLRSQLRLIP